MANDFQKQSWISVVIFSILTLGIYIPYWFRKIKKVTDTFQQEGKLNGKAIKVLMIISILVPFFSITMTFTLNNVETVYTTNIFGIGDILNILRILLIIFLSFSLRSILNTGFNLDLNKVLTFFLGPVFLQHKINSIISATVTTSLTSTPEETADSTSIQEEQKETS